MGIYNRDYGRDGFSGGGGMQHRLAMPQITPVVKWLLIINASVFVLVILKPLEPYLIKWFSVFPASTWKCFQLWRLITYQFLHDPNKFRHIFGNMLGLFFFGRILEGYLGSRRFVIFYLISGSLGGILCTILVFTKVLQPIPLIGASGAIFGIMAAGAILFPKIKFYIFGVFPISYWVLAGIYTVFSLFSILRGSNVGGQATHLMGVAAGAAYVLWRPWLERSQSKIRNGNWQRKIQQERDFQKEVDRILEKVHQAGIASLTRKEKRTLKEATQREQQGSNL